MSWQAFQVHSKVKHFLFRILLHIAFLSHLLGYSFLAFSFIHSSCSEVPFEPEMKNKSCVRQVMLAYHVYCKRFYLIKLQKRGQVQGQCRIHCPSMHAVSSLVSFLHPLSNLYSSASLSLSSSASLQLLHIGEKIVLISNISKLVPLWPY